MTDREFKKHLKKLGIALVLMLTLIVILSVYTLGSTKADLSIYDKSEYADSVKVLGLNEEEMKQYLSIFGNLMNTENSDENLQMLNMATNFIDTMCSAYEAETNENGLKIYDADIVHEVIKEMKGEYIKEGLDVGKVYTYNKERNTYTKNETTEKVPYCMQIESIAKNGDKIEITYQLAMLTNEQIADYKLEKELDVEKCDIKVSILNNTDYEYAKYFVSNIEEKN